MAEEKSKVQQISDLVQRIERKIVEYSRTKEDSEKDKKGVDFSDRNVKIGSKSFVMSEIVGALQTSLGGIASSASDNASVRFGNSKVGVAIDLLATLVDKQDFGSLKTVLDRYYKDLPNQMRARLEQDVRANNGGRGLLGRMALNNSAKQGLNNVPLRILADAVAGSNEELIYNGDSLSLVQAVDRICQLAEADIKDICASTNIPSTEKKWSNSHEKLFPAGDLRMAILWESGIDNRQIRKYEAALKEYERAYHAVKQLEVIFNEIDDKSVENVINSIKTKYENIKTAYQSQFDEIKEIVRGVAESNGLNVNINDDNITPSSREDMLEYEQLLKDPHADAERLKALEMRMNPNHVQMLKRQQEIIMKRVETQEKQGNALVDSRRKEIVADYVNSGLAEEFLDSVTHAIIEDKRKEFEEHIAEFYLKKYGMEIPYGKLGALAEFISSGVYNAHAEQSKNEKESPFVEKPTKEAVDYWKLTSTPYNEEATRRAYLQLGESIRDEIWDAVVDYVSSGEGQRGVDIDTYLASHRVSIDARHAVSKEMLAMVVNRAVAELAKSNLDNSNNAENENGMDM